MSPTPLPRADARQSLRLRPCQLSSVNGENRSSGARCAVSQRLKTIGCPIDERTPPAERVGGPLQSCDVVAVTLMCRFSAARPVDPGVEEAVRQSLQDQFAPSSSAACSRPADPAPRPAVSAARSRRSSPTPAAGGRSKARKPAVLRPLGAGNLASSPGSPRLVRGTGFGRLGHHNTFRPKWKELCTPGGPCRAGVVFVVFRSVGVASGVESTPEKHVTTRGHSKNKHGRVAQVVRAQL